jgi:CRP-like cAMP-binding protein
MLKKNQIDSVHVKQILIEKLGLSNDLCDRFMELSGTRYLKKKDFFVEEGKVCHYLGLVESGVLRSFIEKDTVEYIKDFYFSGSFVVSYGSFLSGEPGIASIQALEDTCLTTLSRTAYFQLLKESNEWYKLGKYISDCLLIKKCRKESAFLMEDAFERYELLLKTYPRIEQHVSQHYIPSYLGIKPESLSRLKSLNLHQ